MEEVYVVMVHTQSADTYYFLSWENWNKIEWWRPLYDTIHEVEHLAEVTGLLEMYSLIQRNGWKVVDTVETNALPKDWPA